MKISLENLFVDIGVERVEPVYRLTSQLDSNIPQFFLKLEHSVGW